MPIIKKVRSNCWSNPTNYFITVAVAILISAFNSLTLSPALAGVLLQPRSEHEEHSGGPLGAFFRIFNRAFEHASNAYAGLLRRLGQWPMLVMLVFALLLAATAVMFTRVPGGSPARSPGSARPEHHPCFRRLRAALQSPGRRLGHPALSRRLGYKKL